MSSDNGLSLNKNGKPLNIKKQVRMLSMPLFLEIALVMMLGAVDTVMLSRYSDNAVAAVGVDNQIMGLVFLVYQFFSMGASVLCAQYAGAGMKKRLTQVVGIAVMMNLVIGITASVIIFFSAESILNIMGLRPSLMGDGLVYLRLTGLMSFVQAVSFAMSASLRSVGKVVWPMSVTAIINLLNIFGNYVLIFGKFGMPAMGVEGAAISTTISRCVAMVILVIVHTKVHIHSYPLKYFRPFPWRELKRIAYIGLPSMGEELSYTLSQVAITYFINKLGNEALACRTYCANMIMFATLFCIAITQGGSIVIGHMVGQQRYHAAYTTGKYVLRMGMMMATGASFILALMGKPLLEALTSNPNIIAMGVWIFAIDVFLQVGRVSNIAAGGMLKAVGDIIYPLVVGLIFQWSIAVGISYFLGIPMGFGLIGMWIGFALDENVRGIILTRRWVSMRWAGKSFAAKK